MLLRKPCLTLIALWGILGAVLPVSAQTPADDLETLKKTAPRIFIDCGNCDMEFIKNEIPFVNYVRDRKEAQVHILITRQSTASGGYEYTLTFMGQNEFADLDDSFRYFSKQDDTGDDVRKGLVRALKQGLAAYVARTPIASRLQVRYQSKSTAPETGDRWNHWVFNIGTEAYLNGEESYAYDNIGLNLTVNRITEDWKFRLGLSSSFYRDSFIYDGEEIKSTREYYGASGLLVKSLGPHWSAGFSLEADSSTYSNILARYIPAPAIEYNVFPYSESSRRQFRFLYRLQFENVRYRETTIYEKIRENLLSESLSATLTLKEKWGSLTGALSGSHYFHDLKMNNLSVYAVVQVNLVKGLNAYAFASGSRVHDQLALAKGTASLEEILLQRRQLATSYSYYALVGISYTFGSVFTNVVNPRFGQLGGNNSSGVSINID
jgi:hypothetical protein